MSSLMVSESGQLELVIHRLLNEAKEQELVERRGEQRFPYFQPGTLTYRYRPEEPIAVFTREISNSGIGLLHSAPLERGEVAVTLNSHAGPITFRTYIVWCKPCGPMYLSGGQFLVSQV
jgi:hypothetical protein